MGVTISWFYFYFPQRKYWNHDLCMWVSEHDNFKTLLPFEMLFGRRWNSAYSIMSQKFIKIITTIISLSGHLHLCVKIESSHSILFLSCETLKFIQLHLYSKIHKIYVICLSKNVLCIQRLFSNEFSFTSEERHSIETYTKPISWLFIAS